MTLQVDEAIQPGLTSINWTSLNIDKYLGRIDKALGKQNPPTYCTFSHYPSSTSHHQPFLQCSPVLSPSSVGLCVLLISLQATLSC